MRAFVMVIGLIALWNLLWPSIRVGAGKQALTTEAFYSGIFNTALVAWAAWLLWGAS